MNYYSLFIYIKFEYDGNNWEVTVLIGFVLLLRYIYIVEINLGSFIFLVVVVERKFKIEEIIVFKE